MNGLETPETRGCQVWLHLNNDSKFETPSNIHNFQLQVWICETRSEAAYGENSRGHPVNGNTH